MTELQKPRPKDLTGDEMAVKLRLYFAHGIQRGEPHAVYCLSIGRFVVSNLDRICELLEGHT